MQMKLALAQINTVLGDVEANLDKHMTLIRDARSQGADLLIFPELSLTGYVLQDLASAVAHRPTPDDPIFAPLLHMSKAEIILAGHAAGVDFGLTHSCYDPDDQGRACGSCDSCSIRREGFIRAGLPDPTRYA